jgi:hypothetical protein
MRRVSEVASIQLWGKGYRVSSDSEEFQRYIPFDERQASLVGLESRLEKMPWGKILQPFYNLTERELAAQRCVLFASEEAMALSFGRTEDKHRRPSLVLTTARIEVAWDDQDLGALIGRAACLCARLADAYAGAFRGNPDVIGRQLRTESFLRSRTFDLRDESIDDVIDWRSVITAVKRWRGVSGVSTPKMMSIGANVVLGTRFEAERLQSQSTVDGFFDVRERAISPLSSRLVPWEHRPPERMVPVVSAPPVSNPWDPLFDMLVRIDHKLDELTEYVFRGDKKRRR